jgi:hypothetical protein
MGFTARSNENMAGDDIFCSGMLVIETVKSCICPAIVLTERIDAGVTPTMFAVLSSYARKQDFA